MAGFAAGAPYAIVSPGAACCAIVFLVASPSAIRACQFDRLLSRTDSRVLAADWVMANAKAHASIYITGSHYGWPDIGRKGRGPEYVFVEFTDEGFRTASGTAIERPDWIVLQESPLIAYSSVPDAVRNLLPSYGLVQTFRAVDMRAPHVYDQQDAFFVPLAGFAGVGRPGPNLSIYRRMP